MWQVFFILLVATIATGELSCKGNHCSSNDSLLRRFAGESVRQKSNISQHEYVFKHKQLFEGNWRDDVKNNGGRRKLTKDLNKNHLLVFKPKTSRSLADSYYMKNIQHHVNYYTKVPPSSVPAFKPKNDRKIDIGSAELRFILQPKECNYHPNVVTMTVLGIDHTFEVDPCQPRWNSINLPVQALQPGRRKSLHATCKDCSEKGVAYTKPHLNVILAEKFKRPSSRRQSGVYACSVRHLRVMAQQTNETWVDISPPFIDLNMCDGACYLQTQTSNAHSQMHLTMYQNGHTNFKVCCVPLRYKEFKHLEQENHKLINVKWLDAIVDECTCN